MVLQKKHTISVSGRVEAAGGVQAAAGQGELHLPRVRHHHEPALPRRGEVRARRR